MFDQPNPMAPKEPTLPPDNPGLVEDIFDSFEPVGAGAPLAVPPGGIVGNGINPPAGGPPAGSGLSSNNSGPFSSGSAPKAPQTRPGLIANKKFFIIGLSAVVIVVLGVGGWLAYARFFQARPEVTVNLNQAPINEAVNANQNLNLENPEANLNINGPELAGPIDTDADGLTDEEEARINTDPTSVDTDNDGLFDREEIKVYKTDPSDADTDDDGYLDGAEARAGYDPRGPGKLFSVETAQ
ncbi:MAG: thrombospondin type 3 repeat-containing protein [bacterium]